MVFSPSVFLDQFFRVRAFVRIRESNKETSNTISLISGDFNNDAKIDLMVANRGDNTVGLLFGNGNGTFMHQILYTTGIDPSSFVSGDFNGDSRLDVGVVNALGNDVAILLNHCN